MMGMELRMRGTYMAGLSLTQPIYTGGKITTGNRLARIGKEVATEQYRMTRMDVLVEAMDTAFFAPEPGRLTSDISSRPELSLLEKQVEAGKEQIRMARADMLPTVGLGVNYMYYGNIKLNGVTDVGGTAIPFSQEFRDGTGMAMLSVKIPIFHWGESRKKLRKARYELQNAELDLQKISNFLISRFSRQSAICRIVTGLSVRRKRDCCRRMRICV